MSEPIDLRRTNDAEKTPAPGWLSSRSAVSSPSLHADSEVRPSPVRARPVAPLPPAPRPPVWLGLVVAASFIVVESVVALLLKYVTGDVFGVGVSGRGAGGLHNVGFGLSAMTAVASAIAFDYFRNAPTVLS